MQVVLENFLFQVGAGFEVARDKKRVAAVLQNLRKFRKFINLDAFLRFCVDFRNQL